MTTKDWGRIYFYVVSEVLVYGQLSSVVSWPLVNQPPWWKGLEGQSFLRGEQERVPGSFSVFYSFWATSPPTTTVLPHSRLFFSTRLVVPGNAFTDCAFISSIVRTVKVSVIPEIPLSRFGCFCWLTFVIMGQFIHFFNKYSSILGTLFRLVHTERLGLSVWLMGW